MKHFSSKLSECQWLQTCQFGYKLLGAPTHIFAWHLNGWSFEVTWHQTYGHETRQSADLLWEAPIVKATWPFHKVSNFKSHDNLGNYGD